MATRSKRKAPDRSRPADHDAARRSRAYHERKTIELMDAARAASEPQRPAVRNRVVDFKLVKGSELKPNPRNWRLHPEAQKNALRAILAEVGIADAAIARRVNGHLELIDGHLRADELADQQVPTLIVDVDEREADKLLLTLDPLAGMAMTAKAQLAELLRGTPLASDVLLQFAQTIAKANAIELDGPTGRDAAPQLERVAELTKKWKPKRGQLWTAGRHRFLCGDSTAEADVAAVLAGAKPTLLVTDPPYGVNYVPGWRSGHTPHPSINKTKRIGSVAGDDRATWLDAYRLAASCEVAYVWTASLTSSIAAQDLTECGYELRCLLVWAKQNITTSRGHYHWQHELLWYGVKAGAKANWIGDRKQSTLWQIDGTRGKAAGAEHGTEKPLECMLRPIRNHAGDVFDPFAGTGTTIVAAENAERTAYAIEIDPGYCAVTLERLADLGLKPKKAA